MWGTQAHPTDVFRICLVYNSGTLREDEEVYCCRLERGGTYHGVDNNIAPVACLHLPLSCLQAMGQGQVHDARYRGRNQTCAGGQGTDLNIIFVSW